MSTRHAPRAARPLLALLLCGSLVLTGCAAGTNADPVTQNTPSQGDGEPTADDAEAGSSTDGGQDAGGLSLPATFPSEVPLLSYELIDVVDREEAAEYRLRMHGTDLEADAQQMRAQMSDAGFEELVWSQTDTMGVSSVFKRDAVQVAVKILDKDGAVEIRYDVGRV